MLKAMKALKEEMKALREKIRDAVKDAREGEERPTPEAIQEIVKQFEDDLKAIATKIADARIQHHKNIASILENEKDEFVERVSKRLRGRRGGPGGRGMRGNSEDGAAGPRRMRGRGRGPERDPVLDSTEDEF